MQSEILDGILGQEKDMSGTASKIQIRFVDQLIVLYKSQFFVLGNYALWLYKLFVLEGIENSVCYFCRFIINPKLFQNKRFKKHSYYSSAYCLINLGIFLALFPSL